MIARPLVKRVKDTLYNRGRNSKDYIDWSKTRVFYTGINLRINLKGREKLGVVSDGGEYANLVDELKAQLLQIIDPATQRPFLRNVYHRDELYHGPKVQDAPDLMVVDEPGYDFQEGFPGHLWGPKLADGKEVCGSHRREGVFIASGPHVKRLDKRIEAQIVDVMPTILYLNHVQIPEYVDGSVLTSIITDTFQDQNPVKLSSQYELTTPQSDGYTDEERAAVEEQLRKLGYF